jgi:hypothetical protein
MVIVKNPELFSVTAPRRWTLRQYRPRARGRRADGRDRDRLHHEFVDMNDEPPASLHGDENISERILVSAGREEAERIPCRQAFVVTDQIGDTLAAIPGLSIRMCAIT